MAKKPPKPKAIDRYEVSIRIPLFSSTKENRTFEAAMKISALEETLVCAGIEYDFAAYSDNEKR